MGPAKKLQLDRAAWSWAETTEVGNVTEENVLTAYRVLIPPCKMSQPCRRNCRGNPFCLSGLGEARWTSEIKEPSEEDETDLIEMREKGSYVGLKNLGATCYVNSLLQLWFHNLAFREGILLWNPMEDGMEVSMKTDEDFVEPKTPVGHLQSIFALMQFSKLKYIDPSAIIQALNLQPSMQQDAQEFSKLFISLIEDKLEQQSNPLVQNLIVNNFRGEYSYITRCSKCQNESVSPSMFYELELNVKGNKTLDESLNEFLKEEYLDGANMYSCGFCQEKQEAARFIRLERLPPVLNLQLMRFVYDRQKAHKKKLNTSIQFPDTLDMSSYINTKDKVPLLYNLTAVLIHKGPSAYSGHYVAHIRDQTSGIWYKFNDEQVEKMEGKELRLGSQDYDDDGRKKCKRPRLAKGYLASSNAYMLVYTAVGSIETNKVITEENLQPHIRRQIAACNKSLEQIVIEAKERKKLERYGTKAIRSEVIKLLGQISVVDPKDYSSWEVIPTSWFTHWLTNVAARVQPIDNTKIMCNHNKLNPNSITSAKYINRETGNILFERYCGGPRLSGKDIFCKECVILKGKGIRFRFKIAEDAKELSNLLKLKEDSYTMGFWVGKQSLKTWRRKAALMFSLGKEETIERDNENYECSSPTNSEEMNGDLKMETETNENESIALLLSIERTISVIKNEWWNELVTGSISEEHVKELKGLNSDLAYYVEQMNRVIEKNVESHSKNGNEKHSNGMETKKIKLEEYESKENGESGDEKHKNDEQDDLNEEFNEDIICVHDKLVHEMNSRRLVPELAWEKLKSYFPTAREFPKDAEVCNQCEKLATESQVIRDLYREQALTQKDLLPGLLFGRNRPKLSGTFNVVSVNEFLRPWRRFVRDAGRMEPLLSVRNSSMICVHGLFLFDQESECDARNLTALTVDEWETLSALYNVDQIITVTYGANGKILETSPKVCFECLDAKKKNDLEALLIYEKAKVYIRPINKSEETENELEAKGKIRQNGGSEVETIRRSSRHRKTRGEIEVTISSNETLLDLKLKILQSLRVAPYDQHLTTEDGRELNETSATLSSLKIFPNSILFLKVDEPVEDITNHVEDYSKTSEPEEGFKGTGLLTR